MRHALAEIAFAALRVVVAPVRGTRRRPPPSAIRRLLLVNRLRIGDSVVTTPFLSHVREHLPSAEITLLVQPPIEELFLHDPRINVLVVRGRGGSLTELKGSWAKGFDAAVILDPTLRSGWIARSAKARWVAGYDSHHRGIFLDARIPAPPYWNRPLPEYRGKITPMHQTQAWLELSGLLGLPHGGRPPFLVLSDADREWARERLKAAHGEGPLVALHPGSDASYRWPEERWGTLADRLSSSRGARLVMTGGPGDREMAKRILALSKAPVLDLAGETTLGRMSAVIAEADALASVDTCATHIASAVGTPCVALFGPGDPDIWRPWGERNVVLRTEAALPCLGCKRPTCALERHECMEGIPVERVLDAVGGLL